MEKGGLKQCLSPFLIHLLVSEILLLGGRSQADDSRDLGHFKCTNRQDKISESTTEQATNLYSSKPVDTTPMQTTSGDASGSTVREASESVEITPKQTTTDDEPSTVMKDCLDVFNAGSTTNGIYTIKPTHWNKHSFDVFCNMTDGGGWTVFQRRVDGSVDFYRNWTSYKEGFGELDHEFWLGNDKLYYLTNQGDYLLRIDMVNKDGVPYYAKYGLFRINDESKKYKLSELGNYSGTADIEGSAPGGHALSNHLNSTFSTFNKDNDASGGTHCAVKYHGAWWYKNCATSNLNGDYMAADGDASSIYWHEVPGGLYNIKYTEMKIRPV